MITVNNNVFYLTTRNTSYWFFINEHNHVEHLHYGPLLKEQEIEGLRQKHTAMTGSTVAYDNKDLNYSLDIVPLEWSGIGKGDYRHSPCEIKMPDKTFTCDFLYKSYEIIKGNYGNIVLPSSYGTLAECDTLILYLVDEPSNVGLQLIYTVYTDTDVITRRVVLTNTCNEDLSIRKLMSFHLDIPNRNYKMVTFDGGWIKEAHRHDRVIQYGMYVNSSTTGNSSNRHNPGFLIAENKATENNGWVYGFNLIYSGNHYGVVERSNQDLIRVQMGINPHCFEWTLGKGESFETPEGIMTFSNLGFNGMSHNFHDFIQNHIVRGEWKEKERPVLLNNWEAHFFKFTQGKLLKLARKAKKLGVELFVLDDGWFRGRNTDNAGLGDYTVDRKKLPLGLKYFVDRIHKMDLLCGLWFEPEMINEDSDLYRKHPEYAVKTPNREPTYGRNQLVLDLCNKDVRDYIVNEVSNILDTCNIDYVKWDMNRHISDVYSKYINNQGEFYHRYILGLYDILNRIFGNRQHILLETCSSGGNRFDLGMLCFSPQIWVSDDTDPIERLKIQEGLSYLYPLQTMGAHVSAAPHQQTLRETPLSTRFNVASFGLLGYELDLKYLNHVEKKEIKNQITFYKKHRKTFQYGRFYRVMYGKENKVIWQCSNKDGREVITGFFQTLSNASEGYDYIKILDLEKEHRYKITTKPQGLYIKRFGGLVKHILPIEINPNGFILRLANKYYRLEDCLEEYSGYGDMFMNGILLSNQFIGSYYNNKTRLLGDFGSNLYVTHKQD